MRFGRQLLASQIPEFKQYYIEYAALKRILRRIKFLKQAGTGEAAVFVEDNASSEDELTPSAAAQELPSTVGRLQELFWEAFHSDLRRVVSLWDSQQREMEGLREFLRSQAFNDGDGGGGLTTGSIRRVTEVSEALERKMHHLQRFSLTNYTAAYKILKKYDKVTGESRMEPTMNEVAAMPFAAKTLGTLSAALEASGQDASASTQPGQALLRVDGEEEVVEASSATVQRQMRLASVCVHDAVTEMVAGLASDASARLGQDLQRAREAQMIQVERVLDSEEAGSRAARDVVVRAKSALFTTFCDLMEPVTEDVSPEMARLLSRVRQMFSILFSETVKESGETEEAAEKRWLTQLEGDFMTAVRFFNRSKQAAAGPPTGAGRRLSRIAMPPGKGQAAAGARSEGSSEDGAVAAGEGAEAKGDHGRSVAGASSAEESGGERRYSDSSDILNHLQPRDRDLLMSDKLPEFYRNILHTQVEREEAVAEIGGGNGGGDRPPRKSDDLTCADLFDNVSFLLPKLPIRSWLPAYNVMRMLRHDVVAGVTIGLFAIPQGLAYALLAELPPVYGIFTTLVPALVYGFLGTSRQGAVGPMSVPALLVGAAIQGLDAQSEAERVGIATAMAMTVGLLLSILGLLRLGFLLDFISRPVLKGFASAAAIITLLSMSQDMLGVHVPKTSVPVFRVAGIVNGLSDASWRTALVSVLALGFLLGMGRVKHRWAKRAPAPLICIALGVVGTVIWYAAAGASRDEGVGVEVVGELPQDIPRLQWPPMSRFGDIAVDSLFIALVAFIEHAAVTKMFALKHDYKIDPDQELFAAGACNVIGSMFQAFPVMAAFGRSTLNDEMDARSQLSLMISAVVALVTYLAVTPALFFLPKAVLAAIVARAMFKLIEVRAARRLWMVSKWDLLVMLTSFMCTLLLGTQTGVLVAIVTSVIVFISNTSGARLRRIGRVPGTVIYQEIGDNGGATVEEMPYMKLVRVSSPIFFANAGQIEDTLLGILSDARTHPTDPEHAVAALIIDLSACHYMDFTGVETLERVILLFHENTVPVLLSGIDQRVRRVLVRSGVLRHLSFRDDVAGVHLAVRRVVSGDAAKSLKERLESEEEQEGQGSHRGAQSSAAAAITRCCGGLAARRPHLYRKPAPVPTGGSEVESDARSRAPTDTSTGEAV